MSQPVALSPAFASRTRSAGLWAAVTVGVFGLFLVYATGFLHPETIHNAAHDARHSFAFPCH